MVDKKYLNGIGIDCKHDGSTYTQFWMGRTEKVCSDCFEVMWHEDKPMTWCDERGNVLLTFDNKEENHAK